MCEIGNSCIVWTISVPKTILKNRYDRQEASLFRSMGCLIITDRKGKVMFSQMSVCPQSVSWLLIHCSALLRRGRYASYWNALLFKKILKIKTFRQESETETGFDIYYLSFEDYFRSNQIAETCTNQTRKLVTNWKGAWEYIQLLGIKYFEDDLHRRLIQI